MKYSITYKTTTEYSGAYVYEKGQISYINIPGGRIVNSPFEGGEGDVFQYNLTDHLGNVRVSFKAQGDSAEIIQEDHYYPFGMRMNGQSFTNTDLLNKFLYNGKELQEQTNYYDYGFRQMDPQLGRWHVVDALAERYMHESPYAYVGNNPISRTDFMGLTYNYKRIEAEKSAGDFFSHMAAGGSGMGNYSNFGYDRMGSGYSDWLNGRFESIYVQEETETDDEDDDSKYSGRFWKTKLGKWILRHKKGSVNIHSVGDELEVAFWDTADGFVPENDPPSKVKTANDYVSVAGLIAFAEHAIMNGSDYWNGTWETIKGTSAKFMYRTPKQFLNALDAASAAKWYKIGGNVLTGVSGGLYALQSASAFKNNNNIQGVSNGLMSFYSVVAIKGGIAGKVLTAPFFVIDATVGMDNFILHTFNYGINQANQIQNGNWGVGFWRPGQGLK